MTVDLFLFLLIPSSIITVILTDLLKTLLNKTDTPYRPNVVALDSAMVSATGISVLYRIPKGLEYSSIQLSRLIALILFTWILSMFLYDKARQTVRQYKNFKRMQEQKRSEK